MLSVSNLEQEIKRLKHQMNAVILGHYYQDSEIQDVADFVGDSLQLSQEAAAVSAEVHCFLRRPLHGRDREDSQSPEARIATGHGSGLFTGSRLRRSCSRLFRERHPITSLSTTSTAVQK